MKIKELKEPYRSLAIQRAKEYHWNQVFKFTQSELRERTVQGAFMWDLSPEGHDFWSSVNDGFSPEIPTEKAPNFVEPRKKQKAWKLKFLFRFYAVLDVLFSPKFELTTYEKDGSLSTKTKFDKAEIDNAGREGKL